MVSAVVKRTLKRLFLFPISFLFSVLYILFVVVSGTVLILPCFIYKWVIVLLTKCVVPDAKILSAIDSFMARDDFHKTTDLYAHTQWNFKGEINFEDFLEVWTKRVMKKEDTNGTLQFPEFQFYVDMWMGYFFHRPDKEFQLGDHIKLYKNTDVLNSFVDRKKLDKIRKEFICTLFPEKKSPWGILIVNSCRLDESSDEDHSVVIFKMHHCLIDGYVSLLVIWKSLLLQDLPSFSIPKLAEGRGDVQICKQFLLCCSAAAYFLKTLGELAFYFIYDPPKLYDKNSWNSREKSSEHVHCILKPLETSVVKEISKKYNVSITTILLAVTTGGFQRLMTSKGLQSPKNIRITYSLPLPNHPARLTNHSTVSFFPTNLTNDTEDEMARLQSNEKIMKASTRGSLMFFTPCAFFMVSSYPIALVRYLPQRQYPFSFSAFLATIPIPSPTSSNDIELLGCPLVGMDISVELSGNTNIPTTICVFKYKQHFLINFGIQKHLLNCEDEVYEVEKYVLEELDHLRNGTSKSQSRETILTIIE